MASRKPKPKVIGAGAVIVMAGGLIGALLFGSGNDTRQVLVAARPIDAGSILTAADVQAVAVDGKVGFRSTPASNLSAMVGNVVGMPIPAGALILVEQLRTQQSAPEGTVLAALTLEPGALPSPDLRFGDKVQLLLTTSPNAVIDEPAQVLTEATVWRVWGGAEGSGRRTVTLAVPEAVSAKVGDASARNLIRMFVVPNSKAAVPGTEQRWPGRFQPDPLTPATVEVEVPVTVVAGS